MAVTLDDKLVVAISSRALFNFEEENRVFEKDNDRAYVDLQRQRLDVPAAPGVAFSLVRKLLAFNTSEHQRVEVVLLSRNDPVSGMRVFRSCYAHGLPSIQRGVFTQGRDPFRYLRPLGAHLFLSANEADVREALHLGYPAARGCSVFLRRPARPSGWAHRRPPAWPACPQTALRCSRAPACPPPAGAARPRPW